MTDNEDPARDEEIGLDAADAERRSMYPEAGYALVEIDLLKPPGKLLTPLGVYDTLEEVPMPPASELTDYVVYDSEGRAYTHDDL